MGDRKSNQSIKDMPINLNKTHKIKAHIWKHLVHPALAIAIAKAPEWDPEVRGPTNLILEWCRLVPQAAPHTLVRAWSAME